MPRRVLLLLPPFLLACAGCLDFEKQTLAFKVSDDGKTAECLLVYEGFFVRDNKREAAQEDLKALAASGQRFYLFTCWPFKFDLSPDAKADQRLEEYKARFRRLLTIRTEGFLETADGKLGLWQTVRTTDAPDLFAEMNRLFNDMLAERAKQMLGQPNVNHDLEKATIAQWEALGKSPRRLLVWDKGILRFTVPASRADAQRMRQELLKEAKLRTWLDASRIRVTDTDQGLEITAGQAGQSVLKLVCTGDVQTLTDPTRKLYEYAKTLPLPVKPGITPEQLVREFMGK